MKKTTWRCCHFTHLYHKSPSYDVCFLRYGAWWTKFLSFWTIFFTTIPLTAQKIRILKKWRKHLEISSFYTSVPKITILFLDMVHNGCTCYFSFWAIFCPFTSLAARKIKKKKISRDIIILQQCTKNHDHMICCFWDMAHDRCKCYFSS